MITHLIILITLFIITIVVIVINDNCEDKGERHKVSDMWVLFIGQMFGIFTLSAINTYENRDLPTLEDMYYGNYKTEYVIKEKDNKKDTIKINFYKKADTTYEVEEVDSLCR